ncbi:MAG: acyltransferase [Burkholderiaceae bacterium]
MLKQKHLSWTKINLDTIRGLAALVVVAGHARGLFFGSIIGTTSQGGVTMGHEAVMVFFVLSGYLVGGSVLKMFAVNSWSWTNYLIKRLVRLWIVLIPAIVIGLLMDNIGSHFFYQAGGIYSAPVGQDYVTSESLGQSVYIILGNVFFLQHFLCPTAGTNTALWSLANEFWYYVAFPLIMVTFRSNVSSTYRFTCALAAIGIFVLIGVHAGCLFLVWILGAVISRMRPRIPQHIAGMVVMVAAVMFVVVFLIVKKSDIPLFAAEMIIAISTGILIYVVKCKNDTTGPSIYSMASRFFSNISYTLYLTHLPFLILLCAIFNSPWAKWSMSPLAAAEFLAISAAAIVWATIVYLMFESNTDVARRAVLALITKLSVYPGTP